MTELLILIAVAGLTYFVTRDPREPYLGSWDPGLVPTPWNTTENGGWTYPPSQSTHFCYVRRYAGFLRLTVRDWATNSYVVEQNYSDWMAVSEAVEKAITNEGM